MKRRIRFGTIISPSDWRALFPDKQSGATVKPKKVKRALVEAASDGRLPVGRAQAAHERLFGRSSKKLRKLDRPKIPDGPRVVGVRFDDQGPRVSLDDGSVVAPTPAPVTATLATGGARAAVDARRLPNLGDDYEVVGGYSYDYSCVSLCLGYEDRWIDAPFTLTGFDELLGEHGFVPLPRADLDLWPGFEKVLVYGLQPGTDAHAEMRERYLRTGKPVDDGPICEHAIVQQADGAWLSKCGYANTLKVLDPAAFSGPHLGEPVRVYVRPRG